MRKDLRPQKDSLDDRTEAEAPALDGRVRHAWVRRGRMLRTPSGFSPVGGHRGGQLGRRPRRLAAPRHGAGRVPAPGATEREGAEMAEVRRTLRPGSKLAALAADRRGAVAVLVALAAPVLLGALAFVIDTVHWRSRVQFLQSAADAAAASSATDLGNGMVGAAAATRAAANATLEARRMCPGCAVSVSYPYGGDPAKVAVTVRDAADARVFPFLHARGEGAPSASAVAVRLSDGVATASGGQVPPGALIRSGSRGGGFALATPSCQAGGAVFRPPAAALPRARSARGHRRDLRARHPPRAPSREPGPPLRRRTGRT